MLHNIALLAAEEGRVGLALLLGALAERDLNLDQFALARGLDLHHLVRLFLCNAFCAL